jgi:hypothetical protein
LEVPDVGNEIGFPGSVAGDFFSLAAVIAVFAAESILKRKIVAAYEVQIAEAIDHLRRVRQRDVARRFASRDIEVLMPRVERRREEATLLPFEGLFFGSFVPHCGRSPAFDNINQLLKEIALRFALASGRDLANIGAAGAAGSDQMNKGAKYAGALPGRHGN